MSDQHSEGIEMLYLTEELLTRMFNRLLHYYSTHTASTLHSDPAMKTMFRVRVPQVRYLPVL